MQVFQSMKSLKTTLNSLYPLCTYFPALWVKTQNPRIARIINLLFRPFPFFFLLAPGVRNSIPTNYEGTQALGKEFSASVPPIIQIENPPMAPRDYLHPVGSEPWGKNTTKSKAFITGANLGVPLFDYIECTTTCLSNNPFTRWTFSGIYT